MRIISQYLMKLKKVPPIRFLARDKSNQFYFLKKTRNETCLHEKETKFHD